MSADSQARAQSRPQLAASRAKLAAQQSALMEALTRQTPLTGFDPERLQATAISLQQKRLRTVEHAHPCIASQLGPAFTELFNAYSKGHPLPAAGPSTDAWQFIAYLAQSDVLPDHMWRRYLLTSGWQSYRTWWQLLRRLRRRAVNHCSSSAASRTASKNTC